MRILYYVIDIAGLAVPGAVIIFLFAGDREKVAG
jgi:hypothetical protein